MKKNNHLFVAVSFVIVATGVGYFYLNQPRTEKTTLNQTTGKIQKNTQQANANKNSLTTESEKGGRSTASTPVVTSAVTSDKGDVQSSSAPIQLNQKYEPVAVKDVENDTIVDLQQKKNLLATQRVFKTK